MNTDAPNGLEPQPRMGRRDKPGDDAQGMRAKSAEPPEKRGRNARDARRRGLMKKVVHVLSAMGKLRGGRKIQLAPRLRHGQANQD
jgi:hypothetical protein